MPIHKLGPNPPRRPNAVLPTFGSKLFAALIFNVVYLVACEARATKVDEGKRYALLIGVNSYDNVKAIKRDGNLSFAESDAQRLAETLRGRRFAPDTIVTMTTAESRDNPHYPSAANVRKQVKTIAGRLREEDSVVVTFAGYEMQFSGNDDFYLCPSDADADDVHTLISLREVCSILERASGKGKLVIVDSCRSMEQDAPGKALTPRLPGRSVGVLFACSAGQYALEVPEKRQGVLSSFVVEALRGAADDDKDGTVTTVELVAYVKARVPKYVKDQRPELIGPVPPIEFTRSR
jgi:uncharacterized caspase-like protein